MPIFDLVALQALADNTSANTTTLSPMSINIIFAATGLMSDPDNWQGADPINGLTDAERDEIDAYIAKMVVEILHDE